MTDKDAVRDALEELYRSRYLRFLRVCMGILREEATAHDAVQEGFARALRGAKTYEGSGSLEAWTWRIVINAAQDAYKARADREISLQSMTEEVGPTESHLSLVDSSVQDWLRALPPRQRLVLFLRYYADLDYRSIATVLDIEVGTVSATLSAAHASLRMSVREVAG
jgi:RNA polymerase sigma factor (sigma-70 family)